MTGLLISTPPRGAYPPPRDNRRRPGNRGFTLIEVTLASLVMLLGILTSLTCLRASYQLMDNARYTTLAGQILQSQMEKLRLLNWDALAGVGSGGSPPASSYTTFTPDVSASASAQLSHFTCAQSITPAAGYADMVDIVLTASWSGTDGRQHSLNYRTRYAHYGISDFYYTTH